MRTIRLVIALLLFSTVSAIAQVPRTINYQGRVKDNNVPLNGQRDMTLKIYSVPTGGVSIYTESHTGVNFAGGIFTVVIGSRTPLPIAVNFASDFWLGVTITGINSGQEITPRIKFHSAASAIRAAVADSAIVARTALLAVNATNATNAATADRATSAKQADGADVATVADSSRVAASAGAITLPVVLTATPTKSKPVVEIISLETTNGIGLRVTGDRYAAVKVGIDSTTRHYVSAETLGETGTPALGGFYRDNAPIAWGLIDDDGTILASFGIDSVLHTPNTPGIYDITFTNAVKLTPGAAGVPMMSANISLEFASDGFMVTVPYWSFLRGASGFDGDRLRVTMVQSGEGVRQDRRFSITVFGRP